MDRLPPDIDVHVLAELRRTSAVHALLDVREPHEIAICALPPSIDIPMQQLPYRIADVPLDRPVIVLCHHGNRSHIAAEYLRANGYENVSNLAGGIDAWAREIDPAMARY